MFCSCPPLFFRPERYCATARGNGRRVMFLEKSVEESSPSTFLAVGVLLYAEYQLCSGEFTHPFPHLCVYFLFLSFMLCPGGDVTRFRCPI